MHNRVLGVGFLLLCLAAAAVWWFGRGGVEPSLPGSGTLVPAAGADAAGAAVDGEAKRAAAAATPAAAANLGERIAAPADAALDDKRPALVGRVLGADQQPLANVRVCAVPGMGFANANGQLDFDTFDFADFSELEDFDQTRMMTLLREQLADRVETTTDAEGRFRIQAKGSSRAVGLRVLARGFAILDRRCERPLEKDVDVGSLVLQKGAIVTGRVVDARGGSVVGARVSRVHEMEARMLGGMDVDMPEMGEIEVLRGGEAASTDSEGRFELAHLTAGDLVLRARHADYPTAKGSPLPIEAGREYRDVLLTMPAAGEIRGVVVGLPADEKGVQVVASRKPRADADPTGMMSMFGGDMSELLADMGMSIGERTAEIAADGKFVLRGLALDGYRVWVARKGSGFAGNTTCSAKVEASPGGVIELRFEAGVAVTFTVVDKQSGAPIERLWVRDRLRGGDGMADMMAMGMPRAAKLASYPGGVVTVASLRPKAKQKLELSIEATGYQRVEREGLELPKTGALDLGRIELTPAPVLQVSVVAADDGRVIAGASVRVGDAGMPKRYAVFAPAGGPLANQGPGSGKTGRDGTCVLNRPVDGGEVLHVTAAGFAPFTSESLAFSATGPTTFTARLHVGGAVDVTVLDSSDKPVKDAVVEHKGPAGDQSTKKTDAKGLAHFEHLPPGSHAFRLGASASPMEEMMARMRDTEADAAGWQGVDVADRAVAALRLQKKPTAALHGIVRENGVPLAGARVAFRDGPVQHDADPSDAFAEMMGAVGGAMGKRSSKTDDLGAYAVSELPSGEHHLQITHKGRAQPARVAIVLRNGDNTFDVELDMTTVRGVVKGPDGQPVEGAKVRVRKIDPTAGDDEDVAAGVGDAMESMMPGMNLGGTTIKSDADGSFELRGVEPDVELLVTATAKGLAAASGKATVARGTTASMAALQLGAAGKVKVTTGSESPFGAVTARYLGDDAKVAAVTAILRKGKATLDGLRPGKWEIAVPERFGDGEGKPGNDKKCVVEVIAGQTVDAQL